MVPRSLIYSFFFGLFTLLCTVQVGNAVQLFPTKSEVDSAKETVQDLIVEEKESGKFPFIAGLVRLSFHDCVGAGGCDGCINHDLDDNKGLKRYTDKLDVKYNGHSSVMSRADFYMLAAVVALENATELVAEKFITGNNFKVGRLDCSNSPDEDDTNENFPKAIFNAEKTMEFFADEFGFSDNEVVALMGAHTLGRASTENSGFEGPWVKGKKQINGNGVAKTDILDHEFYKQLRGNWTQMEIASSQALQWQRPGTDPNTATDRKKQPNMFLNVDLGLAWDLTYADENTGEISCSVCDQPTGCCQKSDTHQLFRHYVNRNDEWLEDFADVFFKMINKGSNSLQTPA